MSSLTKTKDKRSPQNSDMSQHDAYLHALLQLFHQAVKLDMQNMNPGGEKWWFKEKGKRIAPLVLSDNDITAHRSTTAESVRSQGPVSNAACQLAQWMPQPPLLAPSLLPSGHSSGHAHGCYSPAWLNSSVPQNKGAECPLKIHSGHSLPTRRPFSGSNPPQSKTNTLRTWFSATKKLRKNMLS